MEDGLRTKFGEASGDSDATSFSLSASGLTEGATSQRSYSGWMAGFRFHPPADRAQ